MTLLYRLDQVTLAQLSECGGKAARLGDALRLGAPVLPGAVLTTELYRRFMRQGGLQGEIASILATMQPSTMTHFQAAEWAIREAFHVRRIPAEVSDAVAQAFDLLGGAPVAVRSSATNEDSPQQSFVGQHATFLRVADHAQALDAVLGCWMSLYSAKALSYAHRFRVDLLNSAMAVLLQPMIQPSLEGALFTVEPITGDPEVFVIEVLQGPGVGVYRLNPYERQPGELRIWSQLREIGLKLDDHFQAYLAMQWALDGGKIVILRVRPATKVVPYLPSKERDAAVGQAAIELVKPPKSPPRAAPPFSWYHRSRSAALNEAYLSQAHPLFMPQAGREEFYIYGYLYTRWQRTVAPAYDPDRRAAMRLVYALARLYAARTLDHGFRALWRAQRPRLDELNQRDLTALSERDLARHLREVMALHENFLVEAGRLGDSDRILCKMLQTLLQRWVGHTDDYDALIWTGEEQRARCDEALCELAHTAFASDAAHEAAFDALFRRWRHLFLKGEPLAEWQDLCTIEEDRERARARLANFQDPAIAARLQHTARREESQLAERRTLGRLRRLRRLAFRQVLALARRYAPLGADREEPAMLCRVLERDAVREIGRRLHARGLADGPQEGGLLTVTEALDWLEGRLGRDALVRALQERRDLFRRWRRYTPPEILDAAAPAEFAPEAAPHDVLRGRPISRGVAEGRARVIATLGEASSVLPGEILICPDPLYDLTPLFGVAAALVTERGGLLDHASVLAREYNLPAVFAVEGITRIVRTGDLLVVDANRGLIIRRRPEPEWEAV